MANYVRSKDGRTVHEPGCRVRGEKVPWLWAQDKSLKEIATFMLDHHLDKDVRPCQRCLYDVSWYYAVHGGFESSVIGPS